MKTQIRIASLLLLTILCLMLAVAPAMADTLYSNGPYNGNTAAWGIGGNHVVTDSTNLNSSRSNVYGIAIGVWESPGDTLTSVDWSFTSQPNGGTIFASGTATGANLTEQFLFTNEYGYDIDLVTMACATGEHIPKGVSWLNLQNAISAQGNPVAWDENSGPSTAYDNTLGSIPSEAFTLIGTSDATPEPSSLVLFGSGVLGLAGILRRRLMG